MSDQARTQLDPKLLAAIAAAIGVWLGHEAFTVTDVQPTDNHPEPEKHDA